MNKAYALEEAILYLASAIDAGDVDLAMVTGDLLRNMVEWTRGLPGDMPISDVWSRVHDEVLSTLWREPVTMVSSIEDASGALRSDTQTGTVDLAGDESAG